MSHQRTNIRNALKSILTGSGSPYATSAQDQVFKNYTESLDVLPAIVIRDGEESASPRDIRSTQFTRNWEVKIEITVEENVGYDEVLDNIALEVETLINSNLQLNGTATKCVYTGNSPVYDEAGQKIIGKLSMNYQVQYTF